MYGTYTRLLLFRRPLSLLWRHLSYQFFNNFITDWCRVRLKTYFQAASTKFLSCRLHHKLRLQHSLAAKLMAQLGGQPVPKKEAAPLSDGLDGQTPLRTTEFKTRCIGTLNPYPRPQQWQGSGNRLPIRLGRQPRPRRQPPQHYLLRLQRQRPNHRPAPMESTG